MPPPRVLPSTNVLWVQFGPFLEENKLFLGAHEAPGGAADVLADPRIPTLSSGFPLCPRQAASGEAERAMGAAGQREPLALWKWSCFTYCAWYVSCVFPTMLSILENSIPSHLPPGHHMF